MEGEEEEPVLARPKATSAVSVASQLHLLVALLDEEASSLSARTLSSRLRLQEQCHSIANNAVKAAKAVAKGTEGSRNTIIESVVEMQTRLALARQDQGDVSSLHNELRALDGSLAQAVDDIVNAALGKMAEAREKAMADGTKDEVEEQLRERKRQLELVKAALQPAFALTVTTTNAGAAANDAAEVKTDGASNGTNIRARKWGKDIAALVVAGVKAGLEEDDDSGDNDDGQANRPDLSFLMKEIEGLKQQLQVTQGLLEVERETTKRLSEELEAALEENRKTVAHASAASAASFPPPPPASFAAGSRCDLSPIAEESGNSDSARKTSDASQQPQQPQQQELFEETRDNAENNNTNKPAAAQVLHLEPGRLLSVVVPSFSSSFSAAGRGGAMLPSLTSPNTQAAVVKAKVAAPTPASTPSNAILTGGAAIAMESLKQALEAQSQRYRQQHSRSLSASSGFSIGSGDGSEGPFLVLPSPAVSRAVAAAAAAALINGGGVGGALSPSLSASSPSTRARGDELLKAAARAQLLLSRQTTLKAPPPSPSMAQLNGQQHHPPLASPMTLDGAGAWPVVTIIPATPKSVRFALQEKEVLKIRAPAKPQEQSHPKPELHATLPAFSPAVDLEELAAVAGSCDGVVETAVDSNDDEEEEDKRRLWSSIFMSPFAAVHDDGDSASAAAAALALLNGRINPAVPQGSHPTPSPQEQEQQQQQLTTQHQQHHQHPSRHLPPPRVFNFEGEVTPTPRDDGSARTRGAGHTPFVHHSEAIRPTVAAVAAAATIPHHAFALGHGKQHHQRQHQEDDEEEERRARQEEMAKIEALLAEAQRALQQQYPQKSHQQQTGKAVSTGQVLFHLPGGGSAAGAVVPALRPRTVATSSTCETFTITTPPPAAALPPGTSGNTKSFGTLRVKGRSVSAATKRHYAVSVVRATTAAAGGGSPPKKAPTHPLYDYNGRRLVNSNNARLSPASAPSMPTAPAATTVAVPALHFSSALHAPSAHDAVAAMAAINEKMAAQRKLFEAGQR